MTTDYFATIESALEFLGLFEEAVVDAQAEIREQLAHANDGNRRRDAIYLTMHKLEKLSFYIAQSKRMTNDLRTLRRLLHQER